VDLYRIGPEIYLRNFTGLGASYKDGARWNLPGYPVIYFAQSAAVAMLEVANYLPSPRLVPPTYRLAQYQIEDVDYDILLNKSLPVDWNTYPHSHSTQQIGTEWLKQNKKVLILLPSAAVPAGLEKIALFNPNHPDAKKLTLVDSIKPIYSPNMFRSL
jgi:RES domain-containing protein